MAILANNANSTMPIGKSANKNAKSITSIRLVLMGGRVQPLGRMPKKLPLKNAVVSFQTFDYAVRLSISVLGVNYL